jgi:hypothetical protein
MPLPRKERDAHGCAASRRQDSFFQCGVFGGSWYELLWEIADI